MFSRNEIERFIATQILPVSARGAVLAGFARVTNGETRAIQNEINAEYLGEILARITTGNAVFCFNPRWKEKELSEAKAAMDAENARAQDGSIFIATGGTGGRVRFVRHTAESLMAAARAQNWVLAGGDFREIGTDATPIKMPAISYYSPLPVWHVSGLMPVFRCLASGGKLWLCDGAFAPETPLPEIPETDAPTETIRVLSVVPTQLFRILQRADGAAWLRQFRCVLAGGAALSAELLEQARRERIPLGIGYGMTETAAFIALQTPNDFLAAAPNSPCMGHVLPHAKIEILDDAENVCADGVAGRVTISAESLAPDIGEFNAAQAQRQQRRFLTQDEGVFEGGRLRLLGRIDRYINTGGEKVDPRRVEAAILECPLAAAVLVLGVRDAEWGEKVTALVELWGGYAACDWQATLSGFVSRKLAPPCVPKHWLQVARLPFDEKGKLDHGQLAQILKPKFRS